MADITQRGMLKLPLPMEGEVIERSSFLPFGLYQTPEGTKHIDFAWPAPIKKGMDIAHDSMFGPSAKPEYTPIHGADGSTYVSQEDLNEGGAAIAGLAAQGSLLARGAPAKGMLALASKQAPSADEMAVSRMLKRVGPEDPSLSNLQPQYSSFSSYPELSKSASAVRNVSWDNLRQTEGSYGLRSASQPTTPLIDNAMGHRRFADRRDLDYVPYTESIPPKIGDLANDELRYAITPYEKSALDQAWHNKVIKTGELFANNEQSSAPGIIVSQAQQKPKGMMAPRDTDQLGYYSAALEAAKNLKQTKGTPEQMRAMLRSGGMTENEAAATKLDSFLAGKGQVTQQELIDHLTQNRVELKEMINDTSYAQTQEMHKLANEYVAQGMSRYPARLAAERVMAERPGRGTNTQWQQYSLEPANGFYSETVLHLARRKPSWEEFLAAEQKKSGITAKSEGDFQHLRNLHDAYNESIDLGVPHWRDEVHNPNFFEGGHFPEHNIVGHYQSSMVKDPAGRSTFNLDQIQSDWGQGIRDAGGAHDKAKIKDLAAKVQSALKEAAAIDAEMLRRWPTTKYDWSANVENMPREWEIMNDKYQSVMKEHQRLKAELNTARQSPTGHPLVNTTDQWLNTTLRHALRAAINKEAEAISIPRGDTVLSYNPGDYHGMNAFYNDIVPRNLSKILAKIDPEAKGGTLIPAVETPRGVRDKIGYNPGGFDLLPNFTDPASFTLFNITPKVREEVLKNGLPLFANPSTASILAMLDTLKQQDDKGRGLLAPVQ